VIRDCMGNSALSFLPDGRLAYGTSEDQGVTICTIRPPRPDHVVASNQSVEQLALTNVRDGRLLACTVSSPTGSIRVWRVDRDELVELPPLKPSFVAGCVAATPTGLLALGDSEGHQVELYDLSRMQLRQRLLTKTARGAVSAAISTDGRRLAIGFRDGRIALWKLGEADAVDVISVLEFKAHDMAVGPLAFHPDASVLASGSNDQRLKVWNVADGAVKSDFGQQKGWIVSVGFSPDGRKLAATFFYAREVKIWRWPSAEEECTLRGHAAWIPSVAFLKDRRTLVSAGADRVVKIWDLESQQERLNLKADAVIFGSLAISPDEKTIAAGARDGTIRVFRAATEEDVKGRP
jgi:WD40 repeat protein